MPLHRHVINTFTSKQDLIDACLTSVHIPFFIDGKFSRTYREHKYLDGSLLFFLHNTPWCTSEEFGEKHGACIFNHHNDERLMQRDWGFLQAVDKTSLVEMFAFGYDYGLRCIEQQKKIVPPTRLETVWH